MSFPVAHFPEVHFPSAHFPRPGSSSAGLLPIAPGWAFGSYSVNEIVFHNDVFYISNQDANTEEPGTGSQWTEYDNLGEIITSILNQF